MGRTAHLANGASPSEKDYLIVRQSMENLGIEKLEGHVFQYLSGGEKQMVLIARGIAQQASVLIMDESAANLDYKNQIGILRTIKTLAGQGLTILMTTHQPNHAFMAGTKAALMDGGTIALFGVPDDVITTETMSNLYHSKVYITAVEIPEESYTSKISIAVMKNIF
jgi:iron complex transport system ATP-binding protein